MQGWLRFYFGCQRFEMSRICSKLVESRRILSCCRTINFSTNHPDLGIYLNSVSNVNFNRSQAENVQLPPVPPSMPLEALLTANNISDSVSDDIDGGTGDRVVNPPGLAERLSESGPFSQKSANPIWETFII